MRKIINGYSVGYKSLDGQTVFESQSDLEEAIIAGTAANGPWLPFFTANVVEVE